MSKNSKMTKKSQKSQKSKVTAKSNAEVTRELTNVLLQMQEHMAIQMSKISELHQQNRDLILENQELKRLGEEEPRLAAGRSHRPNPGLVASLLKRISKFNICIDTPTSFKRWYKKHELIFVEDGAELLERERTRMLIESMAEQAYNRYCESMRGQEMYEMTLEETVKKMTEVFEVKRSILVRRHMSMMFSRSKSGLVEPNDYTNKISELVAEAKLASMSEDEWHVFMFLRGLDVPEDELVKPLLLQFAENRSFANQKTTLGDMHDEWCRILLLQEDAKRLTVNRRTSERVYQVRSVPEAPEEPEKFETGHSSSRASVRSTNSNQRSAKVTCYKCGRVGHIARFCRSQNQRDRAVHEVQVENVGYEFEDEEEVHAVHVDTFNMRGKTADKRRYMKISVESQLKTFMVDTGSEVTLMCLKDWEKIGARINQTKDKRILCANGSEIEIVGVAWVEYQLKGHRYTGTVYITTSGVNVIGMDWIDRDFGMRQCLDDMIGNSASKQVTDNGLYRSKLPGDSRRYQRSRGDTNRGIPPNASTRTKGRNRGNRTGTRTTTDGQHPGRMHQWSPLWNQAALWKEGGVVSGRTTRGHPNPT